MSYTNRIMLQSNQTVDTLYVNSDLYRRDLLTDADIGAAIRAATRDFTAPRIELGQAILPAEYAFSPSLLFSQGLMHPYVLVLDGSQAVQNNKINAIKVLRYLTSIGLKEAKDAVEKNEPIILTGLSDVLAEYVARGVAERDGVVLYIANRDAAARAVKQHGWQTFEVKGL